MPAGTIDIYIHSSFATTVSGISPGAQDVKIDYPVLRADSLGEGNIPTYYTVVAGISGTQSIDTLFTVFSGTTGSGFTSTAHESTFKTISSGVLPTCLVDYAIPVTSSGLTRYIDTVNYYNTGQYKIPGFQTTKYEYVSGRSYAYFTSTLLNFRVANRIDTSYDYDSNYTSPSGNFEVIDIKTYSTFSGSLITGGGINAFIDSFFAGYVFHHSPFQIICGLHGNSFGSDFEVENISGHILPVPIQITTGLEDYGLVSDVDVYAGIVNEPEVDFDVETVDGRIAYLDFELFSGVSGTNNLRFDVDLLSLKISDLSLDEGEYINADGTLCVDVTDDIYSVVTNGSYFIIDGTVVSGVFTPITDGYRMCYNPVDDFASVVGAVEFQAVAMNDNGDILTKSFYLTSGYSVEYDNVDQDYGQGNKIVIRMAAENFASCPAVGTFAYEVDTVPKESRNLPSIINGLPELWHSDLPAAIYPNSTAFFYEKVMKVEIRAKDYAGNEMEPFIFEFKIEDKP
jgi:hypothetical protein